MAWFYRATPKTPGEQTLAGLVGDPTAGLTVSGRVKAMMASQERAIRELPGGRSSWSQDGLDSLPREEVPTQRHGYGPADNAGIFNALGGKGSVLPLSMLRNLDIAPFTKDAMHNSGLDISGFLVASGLCSLRTTGRSRKLVLMMETIIPFLPEEQAMGRDASRAELSRVLANHAAIADQIWFVDSYRAAQVAVPTSDKDGRDLLGCWTAEGKWAADITLEQQLGLVNLITQYLPDQGKTRCMYTILLCLVSFALRGEISSGKLGKMQTELATMMPGVAEQLSREDIALTWRNFGHLINDTVAARVFGRWLQFIPAPIVRIRVCLAQAAGSGMTSLDIIARALKEHPTFPWYLIIRTYPTEWKNAVRALTLVGDNPYFGYRGDLSEVRSTRYKSVSWFCWRLLVEHGDTRLADYKGIIPDNHNRENFDTLIRGYMEAKPGPNLLLDATPEEVCGLPDLIELVQKYPANTGTLMSMVGHADQDDDS